jgi:hypothetical protein
MAHRLQQGSAGLARLAQNAGDLVGQRPVGGGFAGLWRRGGGWSSAVSRATVSIRVRSGEAGPDSTCRMSSAVLRVVERLDLDIAE